MLGHQFRGFKMMKTGKIIKQILIETGNVKLP